MNIYLQIYEVYMCIHKAYTYTHMYMYVYIYVCMYINIHIYIHIYVCICIAELNSLEKDKSEVFYFDF